MKLLRELNEQVNMITEEDTDNGKKKSYFIEGIFLQTGVKNKNGRVYPFNIVEKEVQRYLDEKVQKNRAYGELGHPDGPNINLERVSHLIKDLRCEGKNWIGRAKVIDTPYGTIVKNLMDEGVSLGVSSRGMGSLRESSGGIMEVQDDFFLATPGDIVADPSAPDAFVKGIMENVEWYYDEMTGDWRKEIINETRNKLRKMSVKQIEQNRLQIFEQFVSKLTK